MKRALLFLISLFFVGCGFYSFSSSSLGGIKTIAIAGFENKSTEYGIEEELTSKLTEAFLADNSLKVSVAGNADAILRGQISKYERVAYTYDVSDNVTEYKVNIYVDFSVEKKGGGVLLERKNLMQFGIYNLSSQSELDGRETALDKLAADIVDQSTKSW